MIRLFLKDVCNRATRVKRAMVFKIGTFFIAFGTTLVFECGTDEDKRIRLKRLKDRINRETQLGSLHESGGHIHFYVKPIPMYTTISIISVMRDAYVSMAVDTTPVSVEDADMPYYKEHWE